MSCKLRCPKCKTMLKERGDEGKTANGEYRVLEKINKNYRQIRCLKCKFQASVDEWQDDLMESIKE